MVSSMVKRRKLNGESNMTAANQDSGHFSSYGRSSGIEQVSALPPKASEQQPKSRREDARTLKRYRSSSMSVSSDDPHMSGDLHDAVYVRAIEESGYTPTRSEHSTDSEVSSTADVPDVRKQRMLSFGALAAAQEDIQILQAPRMRNNTGYQREQKLQNLRTRMAELQTKKLRSNGKPVSSGQQHSSEHHRISKHAPMEQSAKRQVGRRREVVDTSHLYDAQSHAHPLQGDPRFNAAGGSVDRETIRKNYAFLNEYRQQELNDLKQSLGTGQQRKRGKMAPEQEANLKREIVRRENKLKAEAEKERERVIASDHKRAERQKIKEGKTPFFMKKGQIKEQARNQAWEGMKKKERDKAEQKSRRRQEAKEMKKKPNERRS